MIGEAVRPLRIELDRAADLGRTVDFWWRDDDATHDGPALDRLLRLASDAECPLALAAIPARLDRSLVERVGIEPGIRVLVHGLAHADHAPPGAKRAEFGPHRPGTELERDAAEALASTLDALGPTALQVFVPPWNRIEAELAAALPRLGYRGLSAFGFPGLGRGPGCFVRLDTHLDPVDWRGGRSLAAAGALAAMFRRALACDRPLLGLLTHHLVFDDLVWGFCAELLATVGHHPIVRRRGVADMIGIGSDPIRTPVHAGRASAGLAAMEPNR